MIFTKDGVLLDDSTSFEFIEVASPAAPLTLASTTIEFTCTVPAVDGLAFFDGLTANTPSPVLALSMPLGPRVASAWTSRSGRSLFGVADLGPRFWTASSSKLERRRIRSRLAAYDRTDPPGRTVVRGRITSFVMKSTKKGTNGTIIFDEAEEDRPHVCGGCHAIGSEACAEWCPDLAIERDREREQERREFDDDAAEDEEEGE